jgi:hypothetical protein
LRVDIEKLNIANDREKSVGLNDSFLKTPLTNILSASRPSNPLLSNLLRCLVYGTRPHKISDCGTNRMSIEFMNFGHLTRQSFIQAQKQMLRE